MPLTRFPGRGRGGRAGDPSVVPRDLLLKGSPALVCRGVHVRPVIRSSDMNKCDCPRRGGPAGGNRREQWLDRPSRALRQGRWRCVAQRRTVRLDGLEQRASLRPLFEGLCGANPQPVCHAADERAAPTPPWRRRRLGRTAPAPFARRRGPSWREPGSLVRAHHGARARKDRGSRRKGVASASQPSSDGARLRATTPRGVSMVNPTQASDCQPVVRGRRQATVRLAEPLTRPARVPNRPVPPRCRHL